MTIIDIADGIIACSDPDAFIVDWDAMDDNPDNAYAVLEQFTTDVRDEYRAAFGSASAAVRDMLHIAWPIIEQEMKEADHAQA